MWRPRQAKRRIVRAQDRRVENIKTSQAHIRLDRLRKDKHENVLNRPCPGIDESRIKVFKRQE